MSELAIFVREIMMPSFKNKEQLYILYQLNLKCVDLIGPLPLTKSGNRYIITLVDYFSKWPGSSINATTEKSFSSLRSTTTVIYFNFTHHQATVAVRIPFLLQHPGIMAVPECCVHAVYY